MKRFLYWLVGVIAIGTLCSTMAFADGEIHPFEISRFGENIGSFVVEGNTVYATSLNHFYIIDISDKANPKVISSLYDDKIGPHAIVKDDNYVYVEKQAFSYTAGQYPVTGFVYKIDVTDIKNPTIVKVFGDVVSISSSIVISGNYLIASYTTQSDYTTGLKVFDKNTGNVITYYTTFTVNSKKLSP